MKSILVTGASGFIGRECLPLLVSKGYEVHALSRHQPSAPHTDITWHEVDLLMPGRAAEFVSKLQPDAILHLAWYAVPGKFWTAPENLEWVRATEEMIQAFAERGGKRIVVAGSCAEYAPSAGECVENKTPISPTTLYGTSKYELELFLAACSRQTNVSSASGRIFFLYGPHEDPSRLVAYVVRSLLQNEPALCSEGTQILDFMHVQDAASAFVALLESKVQGPVNIASGRAVAVRDVLTEIGRQLDRLQLIRFGIRGASSETSDLWANTDRLSKEVGWAPRFELSSGIGQTIEWWKNRSLS